MPPFSCHIGNFVPYMTIGGQYEIRQIFKSIPPDQAQDGGK